MTEWETPREAGRPFSAGGSIEEFSRCEREAFALPTGYPSLWHRSTYRDLQTGWSVTVDDYNIIAQPAGQRTLALRESYLAICSGDACEAHLLNALERWYVWKIKQRDQNRGKNKASRQGGDAPDQDESLWVRMSAGQWATEELLGVYNEKTVRARLDSLGKRGFVATRNNPRQAWDRTPQWMFNRAAVQTAVNAWAVARKAPDVDPSEVDGPRPAHSDGTPDPTRTQDRPHSDNLPNGDGQSSESTRAERSSNNTGVNTQESKTGGDLDVTYNARAEIESTPPTPSVVVAEPPEVTTNDAALQTPTARHDDHGPLQAGAPDGANDEHPELTDEDLNRLFGRGDENAESVEQVPGGAAAGRAAHSSPVATPAAPEVEEVPTPSSRDALSAMMAASESHDPQATYDLLVKYLGGKKKLNALMEEAPPSLARTKRTRRAWITDISPERAEELVNESRTSSAHPWTAITELLDREIGANITRGTQAARSAPAPSGAAYNVIPSGTKATAPAEDTATGTTMKGQWVSRANPTIVLDVQDLTSVDMGGGVMQQRAVLADGNLISPAELVTRYRQLQVGHD